MNILVTGCMGFIGSNLVPKLLKSGHKVIGFDNLSNCRPDVTQTMKEESGKAWKNFKFFKIDVRDFDAMYSICTHEDINDIVHLAAMGSVTRSFTMPVEYVDNNEKGFVSVCKLAAYLCVTRMVYASSSSVYGSLKSSEKTEGFEGAPLSPYATTKRQNEMFASVWANSTGIEMVGLRFFNVYGPGQSQNGSYAAVIPRFICDEVPHVNGDGSITRDFTFVDDVCDAIYLSFESIMRIKSAVFNVGTGKSTSLNTILDLVWKRDIAIYGPARESDVGSSVADIRLAKNCLGFVAKTDIKTGLAKAMKYFERINNGQSKSKT